MDQDEVDRLTVDRLIASAERPRGLRGLSGLAASVLVWALSLRTLGLAMSDNMAASEASHRLPLRNAAPVVVHLHAGAVFFAVGCALLQVTTGLVLTFTLRRAYHLHSATAYALAIVLVIAANEAALFGLLVWMRVIHEGL